jgi:hypothetical protein
MPDKKDREELAKIKQQLRNQKTGSLYNAKDKTANFKTGRKKRALVGKDAFVSQRGRGFIDTSTDFHVSWTPAKFVGITLLVLIPYIGLIVLAYKIGLPIISGILIAVAVIFLFLGWLIRWMDKNS